MRRLVAVVLTALTLAGMALAGPQSASAGPILGCTGYVAYVIDGGPVMRTPHLVEALRNAQGTKATFFSYGGHAAWLPDRLAAVKAQGHAIGNGSWQADLLDPEDPELVAWEIRDTQTAIRAATGLTPTLFLPPGGRTNELVKTVANQHGLTNINFTISTYENEATTSAQIVARGSQAVAGDIIRIHEPNSINSSAEKAIPQLVRNLRGKGLCHGRLVPTGPDTVSVVKW